MQPINACAGANDTGSYPDSPCPSKTAKDELKRFTSRLKAEGIPYRSLITRSSNVFCVHRYILTTPEHRPRAAEIAQEMQHETRLLYPVTD